MNNEVKKIQQLIIDFISSIDDAKFLNFIYALAKGIYDERG